MRVGLEFSFHKQPPVEEGSRDEDHWRERLRSRLVVVGSKALGAVLQTCVIYTNNEKSERAIKESIIFTIATKIIKYLGINLPKEIKRTVLRKL